MQECKPVKVPIPIGVKLSIQINVPRHREEEEDMSVFPMLVLLEFYVCNGLY
jgi:hypothetical protein